MRGPDIQGAGRWAAWQVALPPIGQRETRRQDATLAMWLVHCPGAHVFWSYWWIGLVHLRPIEGEDPAALQFNGATHELMCLAQDPATSPDPDDARSIRVLHPLDWAVQFEATDAIGERVLDAVVRAIMSGDVSPDTDFRSFWSDFCHRCIEIIQAEELATEAAK
jgi:hypothetical protein